MPKYADPRMTSWTKKGYMDFMDYKEFQILYHNMKNDLDRDLLVILFFTGARPAEAIDITRADLVYQGKKLKVWIKTLKRGDDKLRPVDIPVLPEVKEFWERNKSLPDSFYIFGQIRTYSNVRMYIKHNLGLPAYFFRHNLFAQMVINGATWQMVMETKGGKDLYSVFPYMHLNETERNKVVKISAKALGALDEWKGMSQAEIYIDPVLKEKALKDD